MKKLATAAVAALLGASATANAWWGGPWGGYGDRSWMDDFFGDGMFDFNMNASGRGSGYNRWYDRGYYGYGPYGWGGPWGGYGGYPYYGGGYPYAYPYAAPVAPAAPAQGESK
jgi:hypothetical protein